MIGMGDGRISECRTDNGELQADHDGKSVSLFAEVQTASSGEFDEFSLLPREKKMKKVRNVMR